MQSARRRRARVLGQGLALPPWHRLPGHAARPLRGMGGCLLFDEYSHEVPSLHACSADCHMNCVGGCEQILGRSNWLLCKLLAIV